jgi:hypothetical protein
MIPGVIAVKNRYHNQKTTEIQLQRFFFDQTAVSTPGG